MPPLLEPLRSPPPYPVTSVVVGTTVVFWSVLSHRRALFSLTMEELSAVVPLELPWHHHHFLRPLLCSWHRHHFLRPSRTSSAPLFFRDLHTQALQNEFK